MSLEKDFPEWLELNIGKSLVILLNELVNGGIISPSTSLKMIDNYRESCSYILRKHVKSGRKLKCEGVINNYNCIDGNWSIIIKDVTVFGKTLGRIKSKYARISGREFSKRI
ncbi:transcription initiation factor IIA [Cryptosporidium ryanae]|uniref:transcription initiation factor IIA n=1 Tax=Cryptosporidium ryanae TaxID=515981 RepID=UPI00351AA359|nr:transcription initiation factor IIA [Cryptosporidium ryanae]